MSKFGLSDQGLAIENVRHHYFSTRIYLFRYHRSCRKGGCRVERKVVKETAFEVVWAIVRRGEDTEVGRVLKIEVAGEGKTSNSMEGHGGL